MAGKYATGTPVSVSRSREELYRILTRYGADQRIVGEDDDQIAAGFRLHGRAIQVAIPLPEARAFASQTAYEREVRRLWRVLILLIKGRLEVVEEGAETVEQAFMAYLRLPDGRVYGDLAIPEIDEAIAANRLPANVLPPAPRIIALAERSGS